MDPIHWTGTSANKPRRISNGASPPASVAVDVESQDIAGFYTLAAASVALNALSPDVARKLPRYPVVPAALPGRLAVGRSHPGQEASAVSSSVTPYSAQRAPIWASSPYWLTPRMKPPSVFTSTTALHYCPATSAVCVFLSPQPSTQFVK